MIRVITSIVLLLLLLAALFINSFLWFVFVAGFSVGAGIEFAGVMFKGKLPALSFLVVAACIAFSLNAYLRAISLFNLDDAVMIAAIIIAAPILFIFSKGEILDFKLSVPMAIFGSLWIGYLFSFMIYVYFLRIHGFHYGIQAIFLFAYIVCGNDIGAYYTGKTFGRKQLSPLYSPKKTWEGAVGGLFTSLAMGCLSYFFYAGEIPLIHIGVLAVLVVLSGSLGDLVESLFKRSFNVKDAGGILPGHGGIMDRIDSILMATPIYYWYLHYVFNS